MCLQDMVSARQGTAMTFDELRELVDAEESHLLWAAACSRHSIVDMSSITTEQE